MAEAPADWYPDPLGRHEYRYWNGSSWTEHVADAGQASVDPLEAATGQRSTAVDAQATDEDSPVTADAVEEDDRHGTADDVIDPHAVSVVHEEPRPVERQGAVDDAAADQEAADRGVDDADAAVSGAGDTAGADGPVPGPALAGAPAYPATTQATDARGDAGAAPDTQTASVAGIRGGLIDGSYAEASTDAGVALQNPRMLRVHLGDDVLARQGSMVAFQGSVEFDYEGSGGLGKMFKKMATGEGVPLMRCRGDGDLFLAHNADEIHLLWLDGGGITVSGRHVLAFHPGLDWDIERISGAGVLGGGLFNTVLSGTGWVALTTHGTPVVLRTDAPTFVDSDAVVAWSSNLSTSLNRTYSSGAFIGRGSGEVAQLSFAGDGIVVVQASEGPAVPTHSH